MSDTVYPVDTDNHVDTVYPVDTDNHVDTVYPVDRDNHVDTDNQVDTVYPVDTSVFTSFKVLVTGFGPFKRHAVNASWEAVSVLPDNVPNTNIEIIKEQIEVSYNYVDTAVPQLWKKFNPDLVVHVGVSDKACEITIESCGHKDKYTKVDIYEELPCDAKCKAAEICQYTVPIDQIKSALELEKLIDDFKTNKEHLNETLDIDISRVGLKLSCDAGRYLCEYVYYTSLCIDNKRSVFIHVPPLDKPYSLQELTNSLLSIIFMLSQELMSK